MNIMGSARSFTFDTVEHAVLRDGTRVRLRLVRPESKEILRAAFDRMSSDSRYSRFLTLRRSLSESELRYLCEIDQENHVAIGAVRDDDQDPPIGLGVARFVRLADRSDTAELALAVVDEVHRRGLGRLLMLRLVAAARERGVERFRCEILGTNAAMAALLAQISQERSVDISGGVKSIELVLPRASTRI